MKRKYIASIERWDGRVTAHVRGHNDTHVVFDLQHGESRDLTLNMSRPIEPFMRDYNL